MNYKAMKNANYVVLLIICLLSSCNGPAEVKQSFSFQTSLRPGNDRMRDLTNTMNQVLLNNAKKAGEDKALQIQSGEKEELPFYEDIAFLPVVNATELTNVINDYTEKRFKANQEDYSAQVNSIDFDKNLVLIVSHPKAAMVVLGEVNNTGQALYFDKVLDDGIKNNKHVIKLQSKRLGEVASGMASLAQNWESAVYVLEKKNKDSLFVEIDDIIYPFSLKK
ncbi:hypothetical protein [Pedobacter punctiformis]|uniref:DUF4252 domain-containing protein n=1 Tax=Pedobacter punctiformis TaxID=3004097 RepID=A0ABT4L6V4_9SPHI|nr:hypothetical protein [Pedobacter sp. HCMS5-2]MCZ4243654.1 hypothetical protein [Pedobacter sp. HCMS5-2]